MRTKTNEKQQSQEMVRTVDQWVESPAYLGAERFEIAGALFDVRDKIGETEVRQRLSTFRGGEK
ncbi:hypothetical protein [Brevibacillus sp. SYSU BS000544]|uniref:hypothetical protein n=1 Tax=Brevibacillus sp. SYSU BS000544 TaxID=3416443 RepID=UPI003CE49AB8